MTKILAAKDLIDSRLAELQKRCEQFTKNGIIPFLKVILVGDDPASIVYTRNKKKFCEKIGAKCDIVTFPSDISEKTLLHEINLINNDSSVHGIIIQLPLPKHLSHLPVNELVSKAKDVDGFHSENLHFLLVGETDFNKFLAPCTPKGVINLLKFYQYDLKGKQVVIIGRSLIVGKPLALMLTNLNATVTLCHSQTRNISNYTKHADIIICAAGKLNLLTEDMIGTNRPVVIDVGTNRNHEGQLCGDVDFSNVKNKVSAITPVPGGVGPMTIFSLVENLLNACQLQIRTTK